MSNVLIVAAHPDDEVLGCGGTMARHTIEGDDVYVVYMADGVTSREDDNDNIALQERNKAAFKACEILEAHPPQFLGFCDNRMDSIDLLDVVKALERVLNRINPKIIYTHHAGDLNIDHRITHQAVMVACRPKPNYYVKEIYSFEVPSSTEWATPSTENMFLPNRFVDITKTFQKKMSALAAYDKEIFDFPHSRSVKAIESLVYFRGASMGMEAAEAYRVERQRI
jgi:LmbE family N-acetylglucosaminyl deacetylase